MKRAKKWLKSHEALPFTAAPPQSVALSRRKAAKRDHMMARLWIPPTGVLPRGETVQECVVLGDASALEFMAPVDKTTKTPVNLPYGDGSGAGTIFTVRLNQVDCIETESLAAALTGVEKDRTVCGGMLHPVAANAGP